MNNGDGYPAVAIVVYIRLITDSDRVRLLNIP
jgi:hypothetical protein